MISGDDRNGARARRGARAEAWGRAAEDSVARRYEALGGAVVARRARTEAGELDLVVAQGDVLVFVEVKARSAREAASASMTPARWRRLGRAAECYAAGLGATGDLRLDLATVDATGAVTVFENAGFDLAA